MRIWAYCQFPSLSLVGLLLAPALAGAQRVPLPERAAEPFAILDNSFLIEEAFNQEAGVFQNLLVFTGEEGSRELAFTQEWPLGGQRHQLSYTVPFSLSEATGVGDVALNYRLQALMETTAHPAFSPRLSVVLPTGDEEEGLGEGTMAWQVNLPFSKQVRDVYLHWNAGSTYQSGDEDTDDRWVLNVGASLIWRARRMFHLMLESAAEFDDQGEAGAAPNEEAERWVLSPGFRVGWIIGDHQLVLGAAVPVGLSRSTEDVALLLYGSYELPFRR